MNFNEHLHDESSINATIPIPWKWNVDLNRDLNPQLESPIWIPDLDPRIKFGLAYVHIHYHDLFILIVTYKIWI